MLHVCYPVGIAQLPVRCISFINVTMTRFQRIHIEKFFLYLGRFMNCFHLRKVSFPNSKPMLQDPTCCDLLFSCPFFVSVSALYSRSTAVCADNLLSGTGACSEELVRFRGVVGRFLEGKISPPIANIDLTVTAVGMDKGLALKTDTQGKYR